MCEGKEKYHIGIWKCPFGKIRNDVGIFHVLVHLTNKNELTVKSNSNKTDNSIGEFIDRNSIIFKRGFYRGVN